MKKISKLLFSLIALSLLILPMAVSAAQLTNEMVGLEGSNSVGTNINLSSKEPIVVATNLINTAMMFLGLIAVVIFLVGGFKWMTAMGSDDNIKKAKELMSAGVIGLVIILASWGVAKFVLTKLINTI
ncbi:MAG: hypothetical protein ACOYMB_02765 [Patescibacteria group bacterium]